MNGTPNRSSRKAPPRERRVFVMLPLGERERIALRHRALDARLPLTQLIRHTLGLPPKLRDQHSPAP